MGSWDSGSNSATVRPSHPSPVLTHLAVSPGVLSSRARRRICSTDRRPATGASTRAGVGGLVADLCARLKEMPALRMVRFLTLPAYLPTV